MKKIILISLLGALSILKAQDIDVIVGRGACCDPTDSLPALLAALYYPNGVAIDATGNIFISEPNRIRKVNTSGLTTIYGGTFGGFSGDGGLAINAQLESQAVAVDGLGNVYSADWFNHRIRKITTTGIISTIAGNGLSNFSGDGGMAVNASINGPYGLTVDAIGNIYIADTYNNRIRKINTAGIITTIAGNGVQGYSGDGGLAVSAALNNPMGITFDASGNLYIADWNNNRIRKVNTSGIITTVAGTGLSSFSGDGGLASSATLNSPSGVACDRFGNLFIADQSNLRVRIVNSAGIINTIAGAGTYGYSGDGGPAINAEFKQPWGICTDWYGNLYIADKDNYRIRMITNVTGLFELENKNTEITVFPNPSNGKITIETNSVENEKLEIYTVNGELVNQQPLQNKITIDVSFLNNGIYYLLIKGTENIMKKKLVIINN